MGCNKSKAGNGAAVQARECATNDSTDRWARRRGETRHWKGKGANGDGPCTPEMNQVWRWKSNLEIEQINAAEPHKGAPHHHRHRTPETHRHRNRHRQAQTHWHRHKHKQPQTQTDTGTGRDELKQRCPTLAALARCVQPNEGKTQQGTASH